MIKNPYEKISASLDRFQEAHFWIHMLETHYHLADQFRWYLNVYLKAIKEIIPVLQMELQNEKGFSYWFKEQKSLLTSNPIVAILSKKRDYVVHRSMLIPQSRGAIGITEGRGLKLGLTCPIDALEDSEAAMTRYLSHIDKHKDFLGILLPDEDSMPCVQREWRLPDFENELIDVCAEAWLRIGETIDKVLKWQGVEPPPLSLNCRHGAQRVQFMLFDRDELIARINR